MDFPLKAILGAFLCLALFMFRASAVTTVFIEECQEGKYFWKEKLPTEFYACLSVPRRAVKLRCPPGTYMCNTGPDYFQPCMCKGKTNKYYKQYGISEKLYQTEYVDNLLTKEEGSMNEINPTKLKYMASTMSTPSDKPKGPEGKEGFSSDDEDSMPANGCPDSFRMVESAHMYFGTPYQGSLLQCQEKCISDAECLGVDYNKKNKKCFMLSLADKGTIRFGLNYNAYVRHYRRTYCVSTPASRMFDEATTTVTTTPATTPATTEPVTTPVVTTPPVTIEPTPNGGRAVDQSPPDNGMTGNMDSSNMPQIIDIDSSSDTGMNQNTNPTPVQNRVQTEGVTTPLPATTPTPQPNAGGAASGSASSGVSGSSNSGNDNRIIPGHFPFPGGVIPDSGCPFIFERFDEMSHPFGSNITFEDHYNDAEECKYFCVTHSFCKGVDFDSNTGTCYYLREINSNFMKPVPGVTHFRITSCEPPVKCWTQDTTLMTVEDQSIMNDTHPQTACNGVCYVSQTTGPTETRIQRGCMAVSSPILKPENGCIYDEDVFTIICYCDTPRCNGLSINALASLMLYMPLDGDLTDHSGLGRNGQVPTGYASPNFQCLDKSVNCAALFSGSECISVSTLATTAWGEDRSDIDEFVPTATFAVWFKRIDIGEPEIQGIFGNSIDASSPSWNFMTEALRNRIYAGVATQNNSDLRDYPYTVADDKEWHLAVMTYDGRHNSSAMLFPTLTVYIDCVPVMGNSKADSGPIGIRNQPVSVGCVQNKNFVGFIDEARIFSTVLEMKDIYALKAMRDTNYFW